MKTLQLYLLGIREHPENGWRTVYTDILGKHLTDSRKLLEGVRVFGEEAVFEAIIATSTRKLDSGDPLNYVLAVARNIWKETLEEALIKDEESVKLERSIRVVKEDNVKLAERIEQARRRVDADNTL